MSGQDTGKWVMKTNTNVVAKVKADAINSEYEFFLSLMKTERLFIFTRPDNKTFAIQGKKRKLKYYSGPIDT